MNTKNIIYEYSKIEYSILSKHIIKTKTFHKYFKQDWGVVKAKQYCGILNYDDEDFYLLPKISDSEDDKNLNMFII